MKYLIAIDDGHGMKTSGKRTPILDNGKFMRENAFNRAVVSKLEIILERQGFKTVLTAPTDEDTPLATRVKVANDAKADILVSIHANAHLGKWGTANGLETFYHKTSKEGKRLATAVHNHLIKGTKQSNRGLKTDSLYITKNTHMPAILCECGFMDNKVEAKLLLSDAFRQECAEEIAKGICEYFGVSYKEEKKVEVKTIPQKKAEIYRVQVGAFGDYKNAVKLQKELKSKGYNANIV